MSGFLQFVAWFLLAVVCLVPALLLISYLVGKAVGLGWFRAKRLSEQKEDERLTDLFFKEFRDEESTGEGKGPEAPDQRQGLGG